MHTGSDGNYFAYGPYVREMNLWIKNAEQVVIVAPLSKGIKSTPIDIQYKHDNIRFIAVPAFQLTDYKNILKSLCIIPYILSVLFFSMLQATHIHLRCPGNMGLLGCLMQIGFPWKKKTAKYAGNWDPRSKQPLSYKLQQKILLNTLLSHHMTTLVYGNWPNQTQNILPFFTATYSEFDKTDIPSKSTSDAVIRFIFVGTLTENKQPLLALQFFHELSLLKPGIEMHFYGEGPERIILEKYIYSKNLTNCVFIHGNVSGDLVKKAYQQSHFLLFFSKSEGWPKAVSEAMWWGCVPVTTPVSCVSWMLNHGENGILVETPNVEDILPLLNNDILYRNKSENAIKWAQNYSLEKFEAHIKKLC